MKRNFEDPAKAKVAGRKGGKAVRPENRYFSRNREAAAVGGRKSRYVPPKTKPKPDDTETKVYFQKIGGEYARLMPWEKLDEAARQFWRKSASEAKARQETLVLFQDRINPIA